MDNKSLPNLVVIGAMKCGTTSFHEYLDLHPRVRMSRPKEVNFFINPNFANSIEQYKSLFDSNFAIRGESSQNYSKTHHPRFAQAPEAMHSVIPNAKLIYLVRDPIERFKSHRAYNYYNELSSVNEYNRRMDHYRKTGLYAEHLSKFLNYYHLEQILVVPMERLSHDRKSEMHRVFEFLELDPIGDEEEFNFTENQLTDQKVPKSFKTNPFYRIANRVAPKSLENLMNSRPFQDHFRRAGGAKKLSDQEHASLVNYYQRDAKRLREITGLELEDWSV